MPYNYIVSENITNSTYASDKIRNPSFGILKNEYEFKYEKKIMKEVFKDAVLLIDEAHNIVSSCEDAYGFKINTYELQEAAKELGTFNQNANMSKF